MSEVVDVKGSIGNFTVTVKEHPRYVDMDKCIACGMCTEKCPKKVADEFNEGLSKRKAADIMHGQTVPLKYYLDDKNCLMLTKGKCGICAKVCPTDAIVFNDKERVHEINAGAVIAAPGFHAYDPTPLDNLGYNDHIPDVVTSLEYERLLSAGGPCMGHLKRPSDSTEPRKVAWLQCVGSRNTNKCDNGFCSSVCCMYSIKQAIVTAEHTSGDDLELTIYYMDMRTHGKEFEKYYELAKSKGIRFVRARPHTMMPGEDGKGVRIRYATEDGQEVYETVDMFVHSQGLEAPTSAHQLADALGISVDKYAFVQSSSFTPVDTSRPGVYVSGAFGGPKDIPQSVTEASSAAGAAIAQLSEARGSLTEDKVYPEERDIQNGEPRVGVFVCSCGINIAGTVDVNAVAEYAKSLPNVVFVENNLFSCSSDAIEMIAKKVQENNVNRLVIAACSPRTHEPLFAETLQEIGLNKYLVEMANIRNQNSWVHSEEPELATSKAKDQVRIAVAKAARLAPLGKLSVDVVQKALVVGGGISGMVSALNLAEQGFPVTLLEKSNQLGGNAHSLSHTWRGENITTYTEGLISRVNNHPNITVYTGATLKSAVGSIGNFVSKIDVGGEEKAISYGAAVVATGAKEFKPEGMYSYGSSDRVVTHLEFEAMMKRDPEAVKKMQNAVFIQCVGSRCEERPYCSRVCCTHSVEGATRIKEANPNASVFVLNRDIRTYGLREDLYTESRDKGVMYARFEVGAEPKVEANGDAVSVTFHDMLLNMDVKVPADLVVLATAIVPHKNKHLTELYKCSENAEGFLSEAHPKLRPVDLSVDGLFVAGLCHYPKPVDEAIAQAQAAAARAGVMLAQSKLTLDSIKSERTPNCDGCALCVDVCPYMAIKLTDYTADNGMQKKHIEVDTALCKGCGLCMATCPKEGVDIAGFTYDQIRSQVDAALESLE